MTGVTYIVASACANRALTCVGCVSVRERIETGGVRAYLLGVPEWVGRVVLGAQPAAACYSGASPGVRALLYAIERHGYGGTERVYHEGGVAAVLALGALSG